MRLRPLALPLASVLLALLAGPERAESSPRNRERAPVVGERALPERVSPSPTERARRPPAHVHSAATPGDSAGGRNDVDRIERHLEAGHWRKAEKLAAETAAELVRSSWARAETAPLLAELSLYRAVAAINRGDDDRALWHWYTAFALRAAIVERPLDAWGHAAELRSLEPRRPGEMPAGMERVGDIEQLRLEAAELDWDEGPQIDNPTAARRGPHPPLAIELVVDRQGTLSHPRVLTDAAHPVLIYGVLEWLAGMSPAEPARLDGKPVDSLVTLSIDFDRAWSRGGLLLDPGDG